MTEIYFPDATWQRLAPAETGADPERLARAIAFAIAGETKAPRDLVQNHYQNFGREPFGYAIGPIKDRGDPTGLIIHRGRIIAEWGDPLAVEMTHSVTKSFLSTVVGIAVDRGMIASVTDPVRDYVGPVLAYQPLPGLNKAERFDRPDLLARSPGTICCARPAIGRARCGASPIGPTGRRRMRRNGGRGPGTSPAPSISTTTFAPTRWRWPPSTSGAARCPRY